MSIGLAAVLYASLGLALAGLRLTQGARADDALFTGLFWPLEVTRRWIDVMVRALIRTEWELH